MRWWLLLLLAGCTKAATPSAPWSPGQVYSTRTTTRGLLDLRGLIHAHSIYSHDACDNEPVKNGVRDQACFEDFRRGLCQSKHDFVMLTDHGDAFSSTTFPEAFLHRPERGDVLVNRGGPVGSFMHCPDGHDPLILAGFEAGFMPVGLEQHPSTMALDPYGKEDATTLEALKSAGAVTLIAHTEEWTPERLIELPLDGFEMFNLHANALLKGGVILELLVLNTDQRDQLPHPDLIFLPIWSEDPRYLRTWGTVLARGAHKVTTMGTDCHQNTLKAVLPDGERGDSYRRMMLLFSNHLLVQPEADGTWDDRHLKAALKKGRLYGVLESLGYAEDFAFTAQAGGQSHEMGDTVAFSSAPVLEVSLPRLRGLDPGRTPPKLTVRILRAIEGGFEEVASGNEALRFSPTQPGAYRAEVRMVPHHLKEDLGKYARELLQGDLVWIYANPIYIE